MKLRVVGWTSYYDNLEEGQIGWAARNAIIDDIKKHGYKFSGGAHQESYCCTPVLNDGKIYRASQRGWGGIMAEAYGHFGAMDYELYTYTASAHREIRPEDRYYDRDEFTPETDLNERFELGVSSSVFEAAKTTHKITVPIYPEFRYLDVGDTLALKWGEKIAEYTVAEVCRKRNMSQKKLDELEMDFFDNNPEKAKRAEEEINKAKVVLVVKFA